MLDVQLKEPRVHIAARIPKSLVEEVDRIAKELGVNRSQVLRAAVELAVRHHRRHPKRTGTVRQRPETLN